MIIRFSVSNYRSFRELTDFNMLTGDVRTKKNHIDSELGIDILKFSLIYGPNGAGKSNLIRAIDLLRGLVTNKRRNTKIGLSQHRFKVSDNEPSVFEIEFVPESRNVYIYGISILNGEISNEYLYHSGLGKGKDKLVFERKTIDGKANLEVHKNYVKTKKEQQFVEVASALVSSTELVLCKFIDFQTNIPSLVYELTEVEEWFKYDLRIIYPTSRPVFLLLNLSKESHFLDFSNNLLKSMDLGIESLLIETYSLEEYFGKEKKEEIERIKKRVDDDEVYNLKFDLLALKDGNNYEIKKLMVKHKECESPFSLMDESDGTRRLIEYLTLIYEILDSHNSTVWLVDEFERSIHPSLLKGLLKKLVNSEHITGQLIFTTHECNLMDLELFRQDEIWLAEKDKGATKFSLLSSFKVRNDLDIQRGYLKGRFEAIPFLGNLEDLNWYKYASN